MDTGSGDPRREQGLTRTLLLIKGIDKRSTVTQTYMSIGSQWVYGEPNIHLKN